MPDAEPGDMGDPPGRATVEFADGPVTILPKRAPVGNSGPIRGHSLAIFPGRPEAATAVGAIAARIEPGDSPAHAVLDLTEAEAISLARALGLAEILFWDGRRASVLACG